MVKHQHTSEITVHLNRLDDNVQSVRNQVGEQTKLMGVIKDNAYGHGLIDVARHLAKSMDWFCVSQIEEAVEIRKALTNCVAILMLLKISREMKKKNLKKSLLILNLLN